MDPWTALLSEDDVQKVVSLCVDGKEAQLVFIDHAYTDMSVRQFLFELILF
jgi:hypothetical protein